VSPWELGTAVSTPSLPSVHDLNYLRLDREPAGARELVEAAEELQAGAGERRIRIEEDALGAALAPELEALGWQSERLLVMAHRGAAPEAGLPVERLAAAELVPAWTEDVRSYSYDAEVVRQLVAARRRWLERNGGRGLGARVGERIASWCDLYLEDGTAEVEGVATLAAHRRRGLARAVVSRAVADARAAGAELVFLIADADDWPQELYERLGFETIGRRWKVGRA
jgi:ribosomal protein S18 acetylase RimI-like enzyme